MPRYFDTHVHFDLSDRSGTGEIVESALAAGVARMLAVGGSADANEYALGTVRRFPDRVCAAVGYDRESAGKGISADDLEALLVPDGIPPRPVAIGEIGLDFFYHPDTKREQRLLFADQLALAARRTLPVVVHSRDAECETADLLAEYARAWKGNSEKMGVLHCFTGTVDFARRILDIGMMVSFSGIVTFANAASLRETAKFIPDDRLLIETDSPFLAPVPHRGKKNCPGYLPSVAEVVASVRACPVDHVAEVTFANAETLFGFVRPTLPAGLYAFGS